MEKCTFRKHSDRTNPEIQVSLCSFWFPLISCSHCRKMQLVAERMRSILGCVMDAVFLLHLPEALYARNYVCVTRLWLRFIFTSTVLICVFNLLVQLLKLIGWKHEINKITTTPTTPNERNTRVHDFLGMVHISSEDARKQDCNVMAFTTQVHSSRT